MKIKSIFMLLFAPLILSACSPSQKQETEKTNESNIRLGGTGPLEATFKLAHYDYPSRNSLYMLF